MINRFLITGDCHGEFSRFKNYDKEIQKDPNTAVIILGDAGLNWTLDEYDAQIKNSLNKHYSFTIYCVRGNHEARPQNVEGMHLIYDEDVHGEVYIQDKWPKIKYFKDFGLYLINDLEVAVIGGAYSVDKWYRLKSGFRWFEDEQLTDEEMIAATAELTGMEVDIVLTHTCPISWVPRDLFLSGIDQSNVDNSMELFLEEIAKCFGWKVWLFGHYHSDRLERPGVEQLYRYTEKLEDIWSRFTKDTTPMWWLPKAPMYYAEDELLKLRDEYWKNIE